MSQLVVLTLCAAAALPSALAAVEADRVLSLPGFPGGRPFPAMFSGYLNIPGGKHMHYVFFPSTAVDPAKAPVTFWTEGGPGCSSLEGAFNQGPLLLQEDGSLAWNPYSWNNVSSGLYLEQPAGVGFSFADTAAGLVHNDTSVADDNLNAVIAFFGLFPEFASNDFYVAGVSYGGIYVPMLAQRIVQYNQASPTRPINLKGILVGNGCIGCAALSCGDDFRLNDINTKQWRGHGLISSLTYQQVQQSCDWNNPNSACQAAIKQAANEVGHIDVYYIYDPECINTLDRTRGSQAGFKSSTGASLMKWNNLSLADAAEQIRQGKVLTEPVQHFNRIPISNARRQLYAAMGYTESGPDACINVGAFPTYFNSLVVRQAMHVVEDLSYHWTMCTGNMSYTPTMQDERVQVYPDIINSGARVLIYNGEADACVPFEDNEIWTSSMNYTVVSPWHAWMVNPANVGGYATVYTPQNTSIHGQFQFVTVRGAGHMVPETQPEAAWVLFNTFISGKTF